MNNLLIDYLFDFAVILTYEIHEAGSIDYKKAVNSYCENEKLDLKYKQVLEDYCKFYLKENKNWFPDKEEVVDWYIKYKSNNVVI